MKTLFKVIVLTIGYTSTAMIHQSLGAEERSKEIISSDEKTDVGSSAENPVVLRGIKKIDQIKNQQQEYIRKHYEGYHFLGDMLTMNKGRFIQILTLRNDEGQIKLLFFDMSDAYKRLEKSSDKKTRLRVKEIEDLHDSKKTKNN